MNETPASVEDFDLRRHAVIEASAGTGKTYTIEQLVLRLLTEAGVRLEQILIVTFTEKATGELRTRLRTMLDRAWQEDVENATALKAAFDHFDQAPIFTIHGFCQRILQEYALEQGQDFRPEQASDVDLLRALLREIQRKHWRAHFGNRLKAVLENAGYNRETADQWDEKVLEIATRFKPRSGHQLRPAGVPDWWRRLDEVDANWAGQLEIFTIDALHQHLRDFKRQRGLQSFDDMIASVEECLDPAKNSDAENFLAVLRERYSYGIVDEFQDTDPLQWRIFRNIFLTGGESKLFIVGDPKQAIYGFRGSDLPTYLQAAAEMKADHGAGDYPLAVNWRSDPDLLEALKCLFGDGDWFPHDIGIRYQHVHAPDDDKRQSRTENDRTDRAALTIVDMSAHDRLKLAHKNYARFIGHEIQRLLTGNDGQPLLSLVRKDKPPQPLNAGDICVLVMKRAEAEPITQTLDLLGIPYSFYKQSGLWDSDEATHLQVLLQTLAQPDDRSAFRKALLTCFFRVKPAELALAPDVPIRHPARQLYQTWLDQVENRQWSALCRSLLEDTGLLFDEPSAGTNVATLEHLLRTLEQVGHGENLDLLGVLEWIGKMRTLRDAGDANMLPVETGRAKVKIMTIHASKGLEFPIVFLGGGFTQRTAIGGGQTVYRDDQGRIVFDLGADAEAQDRVKAERLSEQRRVLYVALTRPIFKLYIPKVKIPRGSGGYLGPVGSILLPALEQSCPDKLGPLIAEVVTPPLRLQTPALADKETGRQGEREKGRKGEGEPLPSSPGLPVSLSPCLVPPFTISGPLFPAFDIRLTKKRIVVRSFSSMARQHLSLLGESASFGEQTPIAEDETATPLDREDPLRGPVFGDMVHNILETIDFAEVGRAASPDDLCHAGAHARKCLDAAIQKDIAELRTRTPIDQLEAACRQQIADLIWHSLKTPLAAVGGPLCAVEKKDRLHEVEFLFPERIGAPLSADKRWEEGFVTGFMDLLFRGGDRYFLLDWKTNLLPGYRREQIERSMADSDYHRQYRLYLHAARRWFERVHGPKFDFLEEFGGVYYLYVRGMNGRDETTGVYFHRPTKQDLDLDLILK